MAEVKNNEQQIIIEMSEKMAEYIRKGYKVSLYPVKEGIKITSHKEKRIK